MQSSRRPYGVLSLAVLCAVGCHVPNWTEPVTVTALTPATHTAFPLLSGAHANADCNACHGDFDTFTQFTCLSCHEHSKSLCDSEHSGMADYGYNSDLCLSCHPNGSSLSSVDHARVFPIAAGTAHENIPCATCHVLASNRAVVDCVSCHPSATMAPAHTQVTGYAWASSSCLTCHGDSQVDRVSSHPTFCGDQSITRSRHASTRVSCLTCHPTLRADKPFAANFGQYSCLSCHDNNGCDQ